MKRRKKLNENTDAKGTYNAETTKCVMKMLERKVAEYQVPGVIEDASELCGKTMSSIPSQKTINR